MATLATAGGVGLARRMTEAARPAEVVEFYPLPSAAATNGPILGRMDPHIGAPLRVELRLLEVGHFRDLVHEGDGRIAYLYEATLPGRHPRRGLIKLDGARPLATA